VAADSDIFAFERCHASSGVRLLVALDLGQTPQRLALSTADLPHARMVLSTALDHGDEMATHDLPLRPAEGVIVPLVSCDARPAGNDDGG
jgi:hypothetical protein